LRLVRLVQTLQSLQILKDSQAVSLFLLFHLGVVQFHLHPSLLPLVHSYSSAVGI
jgi:hypothetical protein